MRDDMVNVILCDLYIDLSLYSSSSRDMEKERHVPGISMACVLTDTPYSVGSLHLFVLYHV